MGLKLKSTGGTGSVQLNAPANHNPNTTITLPADNVTDGQFVLADGSGNVNIDSGTLYVDAGNDRVGVGETSPDEPLHITASDPAIKLQDSDGTEQYSIIKNAGGDSVYDAVNGTGVGGDHIFRAPTGSANEHLRITSDGEVKIGGNVTQNYGQAYGYMLAVQGPSAAAQTFISIPAPGQTADSQGLIIGTDNNASLFWQRDSKKLAFATDNSERVRIQSGGYVSMGGFLASTGYHRINGINTTEGGTILNISGYQNSGGSSQDTAYFFACGDSTQPSTSASAVKVFRISSTSRSISAAGSINASGADYAEYMLKAGDFTIAKGDVCGVNAEGKLTNVFADAISFVVKSTNPSYVGGDTWHLNVGEVPGGYDDDRTEEEIAAAKIVYEQELEAARQMVDRIAFSGQVPVNVTGTTPGQYIVPAETADGGIEGVAKNEADLTFAEYMRAVGKVIATEDDGRARIIVKVA